MTHDDVWRELGLVAALGAAHRRRGRGRFADSAGAACDRRIGDRCRQRRPQRKPVARRESPRWSGRCSTPTSTPARPASCAARAGGRCRASAIATQTGCSWARHPAPTKTRRASPSSDRRDAFSTTCWRRSGSREAAMSTSPMCSSAGRRTTGHRSRRGRGLPTLPRPPDRPDPAAADRRAGQERRDRAARTRRDDRQPARPRARLRGYVPLVVTYHPAYLLRTLHDKAKAWEDLVLARRTLSAIPVER